MLTKKGKQKKLIKQQIKSENRKRRKEQAPPKKLRNRGKKYVYSNSYQVEEAIRRSFFGNVNPRWGRYADFRSSGEPLPPLPKFKPIRAYIKFKIDWRKEGF